jgi:hypothetical protein
MNRITSSKPRSSKRAWKWKLALWRLAHVHRPPVARKVYPLEVGPPTAASRIRRSSSIADWIYALIRRGSPRTSRNPRRRLPPGRSSSLSDRGGGSHCSQPRPDSPGCGARQSGQTRRSASARSRHWPQNAWPQEVYWGSTASSARHIGQDSSDACTSSPFDEHVMAGLRGRDPTAGIPS